MRVMREMVGETLSHRYQMVARVSGGGMGEVYRGHDLLLDRSVAIKVLQPSLASDPEIVERFRAEARAAARLNHPNIVHVHDWGCEDDRTYYMVMEYVSGTDLRDVLVTTGSLEPAQAVEIVASMCDALYVAHAAGLVHRDVKPENVLLNRLGEVKVVDFGIAAFTDAERTQPGGILAGTLRYISPEQARGQEATFASDIWAAGAVLAELLTGLPPLQGAGTDLLHRRAHEPPQLPSSWDPRIPEDLDAVVAKACAVEPADRFTDASEMSSALRRVAARSLPEAPPVSELTDQVTGDIVLPDMQPTTHIAGRKRGPRRKGARLKMAFAALLALLLIAGGAKAVQTFVLPQMVQVPDLSGMSLGRANDEAAAVDLDVVVSGRKHDPTIKRGAVISQTPESGELQEGSKIELILSSGPPKVALPKVIGLKADKAEEILADAHLKVGTTTTEYSLEKEGTVIGTDPPEGKLTWGEPVNLVVSKGPQPTSIPTVEGLKLEKAKGELEAAGFSVIVTNAYSDDIEAGRVIKTEPGAGEIVGEGSTIEMFVSAGPQYKTLKMPDVRGMNVDAAKAQLEQLGLRVHVEQACPGTTVVDSTPSPGTTVQQHDLVAIFVCN
jgi:serine/threonine-protein kinase